MIAVIGGMGMGIKVNMVPRDEPEYTPVGADRFDYSTLNVAAEMAQNDDVTVACNGCGFNMASCLAAQGHDVAFASVVGDDPLGLAAVARMKAEGIDTEYINVVKGDTPVKVELFNILGDPQMVFGNSRMYERITPDVVQGWDGLLCSADVIVMDGHLPEETIEYIAGTYGGKGKKIFFDPADHMGAAKAANVLDRLYCVMPGRLEAEAMIKRSVLSEDELMAAGSYFHEKGIERIVITLKGGGLYYKEGMNEGILRPERILSFSDTSGAGDVTSAAVISATLKGMTMEETAVFAMEKAAELLSGKKDERKINMK